MNDVTYIQDVTYREVREALFSVNQTLRRQKNDPKITLALSNNRMELEKANERFEGAVDDLEQNYLETDEDGNPKTEMKEAPNGDTMRAKVYTDREAFLQEVEELLDEEITGGLRMEQIPYDAFGAIDEQTLTSCRDLFLSIETGDEDEQSEEAPAAQPVSDE